MPNQIQATYVDTFDQQKEFTAEYPTMKQADQNAQSIVVAGLALPVEDDEGKVIGRIYYPAFRVKSVRVMYDND